MVTECLPLHAVALRALAQHDRETYEHCLAVGRYAGALAERCGLDDATIARASAAGCLHDVGKTAVPVDLLRERNSLGPDDRERLRAHAALGADLVASDAPVAVYAPLVRAHHERIDGRGYPDRLAGSAIPIESRIVAVADTFDALTMGRPYRAPASIGEVVAILTATRNRQWDADLVDVFVRMVDSGTLPLRSASTIERKSA